MISDMSEEDIVREIKALEEEMRKEATRPVVAAPSRVKKKQKTSSSSSAPKLKKQGRSKAPKAAAPARVSTAAPEQALEESIQKLEQSIVAAKPGSRAEELAIEREIKRMEKELAMEAAKTAIPQPGLPSTQLCICRKPYDGRYTTIECDGCKARFHLSCLGLSSVESDCIDKYFCDKCQRSRKKGRRKTIYKPIEMIELEIQNMNNATRITQEIKKIEAVLRQAYDKDNGGDMTGEPQQVPSDHSATSVALSEVCCICNFPGSLFACARCSKGYHGSCLANPPAKSGNWTCPPCTL
eukprot:gb/GEZN01007874.1/.p1 GENE.gb/GEZN01007874.1/~~gb/GEZN01007874.1/.p1  ORF type:complete len:297 (-),score=44.09 gb/GEZN01007874.1/:397-1287(-)